MTVADNAVELYLSDAEFAQIASVVEAHFGISLPAEKRLLVSRRLRGPLVRAGFGDYASWARANLAGTPSAETLRLLADALTTNHTYFWREFEHFVHFRDAVLPERIAAHQSDKDLRVWCAAAATGEEPYQLAMIVRDALGTNPDWKGGVLATDLSEKALATARAGTYPADRLEGLPEAWRNKYVRLRPDGSGTMDPSLKADVTYRRLNLLQDRWNFRRPFDVIFCRNVLIYFEPPIRERVVTNLIQWLLPGGTLYVGHSEALPRKWGLRPLGPGMWRKERA